MTDFDQQPFAPMGEEPSLDEERREQSSANAYRRTIFSVPVDVTVSIGQQSMSVSDLLSLKEESIVPLTAGLEDPVELLVDGRIIARGDLIEGEEGTIALRITEIPEQSEDD